MSVVRASHAFLGKQRGPEIAVTVLDNDGLDVTPQSLFVKSNASKVPNVGGYSTTEGSLMTKVVIQMLTRSGDSCRCTQ